MKTSRRWGVLARPVQPRTLATWGLAVNDFEGATIVYDRAKVARRIRRATERLTRGER